VVDATGSQQMWKGPYRVRYRENPWSGGSWEVERFEMFLPVTIDTDDPLEILVRLTTDDGQDTPSYRVWVLNHEVPLHFKR
jgi:hypothetical protein